MSKYVIFCFALFIVTSISGQVVGIVSDQSGEPLPLVSIYVQGTSMGTTTNLEGQYVLKLTPGNHTLVYQFIGYETVTKDIVLANDELRLDVVLSEERLLLQEVVVAADAEDPAYRVIRQAIKKRKEFLNQQSSYVCEVYVKGYNKILNAPEKIMGVEVGDLEGALDSNRQGIIYLSESISTLYSKPPDVYKEIITSSKISGDDQGYSFNSAKEMQFNIYENRLSFARSIVTPISENALNYYRYRLDGTFYDQNGLLVNKIEVRPKSPSDPAFFGFIYIVEDIWNVHSLDLSITAESTQVYFLDTLRFEQVFIPKPESTDRSLFSNIISFKAGAFGFNIVGEFTAIYNNYEYDPDLEEGFFNHVSHIVEPGSNERDSSFWAEIRPVPLTFEESKDYVIKDSIFKIRDSPAYKDSVDREHNKFSLSNLFGGYSRRNSQKHSYLDIGSPIGGLSFNTVQGFRFSADINYFKYFDEKETKRILYYSKLDYGFSEKKWRYRANILFRPNRLTSNEYAIFGGSGIYQYNTLNPISDIYNMAYSLLLEENYAKYYSKNQLGVRWQTDLIPGIVLNSSVRYEDRKRLVNTSDFTFFDREDKVYSSNDPVSPNTGLLSDHQAFLVSLNARIRFGQKYSVFPDRRFSDGFNGPQLRVSYLGAFDILGGDVSYHRIGMSITELLETGVKGDFSYYLNAGTFLSAASTQFVDYKHFLGNQILLYNTGDMLDKFYSLPYYDLSTNGSYIQAHINHDFNGWLLGRIPLFKRTGYSLVAGAKYLKSSDHSDYYEMHIGVKNIGWDLFRFFRIDAVMSQFNNQTQWNLRIGLGLSE